MAAIRRGRSPRGSIWLDATATRFAELATVTAKVGRKLLRNALVTWLLTQAVACYVAPYTPLYDRYIRVWDNAAGDLRYYYAVWVTVLVSFVLASGLGIECEGQTGAAGQTPQTPWHQATAPHRKAFFGLVRIATQHPALFELLVAIQ